MGGDLLGVGGVRGVAVGRRGVELAGVQPVVGPADGQQLVVGSEGSPSVLSVVPVPAAVAAAGTTPPTPVPSLTDFTSSGLSPITTGLIAAAVATVVVWIGGKLSRRPSP